MVTIPGTRTINAGGFAACVSLMAFAYYAQFGLGLEPCPLCIFQRFFMILTGLVFLVAAVHGAGRTGRMIYAALVTLMAAGGAAVAGRHVWLQSLPADQVPACGPGLEYMMEVFAFSEVLEMVFTGSGECAEVSWRFLGLSMPTWVLLCFIGLGVVGLLNNLRRPAPAAS